MPKMAPGGKVCLGCGEILGSPLGMLCLEHVPGGWGGCVVVMGCPAWEGCGISLCSPPPTGAPLPAGLSRLFGVLGDLEGCHRLAQPPAAPAPALLQLQT